MASPLYTVELSVDFPGVRGLRLPSQTNTTTRFCALSCADWCKKAGTDLLEAYLHSDPIGLEFRNIFVENNTAFFAINGGETGTDYVLGVALRFANLGREDVAIDLAIDPLSPFIATFPDTGLVSNGEVITNGPPVDLALMGPPPDGNSGDDLVLIYRPGVGAFLNTLDRAQGVVDQDFVQNVESTTWVITHNLGRHPEPRIVTFSGDRVEAGVHYNSPDQLTLSFNSPFAGRAYL